MGRARRAATEDAPLTCGRVVNAVAVCSLPPPARSSIGDSRTRARRRRRRLRAHAAGGLHPLTTRAYAPWYTRAPNVSSMKQLNGHVNEEHGRVTKGSAMRSKVQLRSSPAPIVVLGAAIVQALLDSGAAVYGAARDPGSITNDPVIPVRLDVRNDDDVAEAVRRCGDVSIVVNNAGILRASPSLADGAVEAALGAEMETNFFGSLRVARAFAPILRDNGGGALVNVLSVLSFVAMPQGATYSASKSAACGRSRTRLRIELRQQGTLVVAVHAGFIDTDMAAGVSGEKVSPESVARQIVTAVADGAEEVLADPTSEMVKAALPDDLTTLYPALQAQWDTEMAR